MSKFVRVVLVALSALMMTACQSTREAHYGSGPLTLSDRAQATFKEYLQTIDPGVFIVSADGRLWTYTYCDAAMCDWNDINNHALMRCSALTNPVPCKIYADRRTIVWRFDGKPKS